MQIKSTGTKDSRQNVFCPRFTRFESPETSGMEVCEHLHSSHSGLARWQNTRRVQNASKTTYTSPESALRACETLTKELKK